MAGPWIKQILMRLPGRSKATAVVVAAASTERSSPPPLLSGVPPGATLRDEGRSERQCAPRSDSHDLWPGLGHPGFASPTRRALYVLCSFSDSVPCIRGYVGTKTYGSCGGSYCICPSRTLKHRPDVCGECRPRGDKVHYANHDRRRYSPWFSSSPRGRRQREVLGHI